MMKTDQRDSDQVPKDDKQVDYFSYLLRLWREGNGGEVIWRASLEDAHSGEKRGFVSPEALIAYLLAQINHEG